MSTPEAKETKAFWNRIAHDWDRQVGDTGDKNRVLNSDPVVWSFLGNVEGKNVLDAGCGTGYFSRQLSLRGARVVGEGTGNRLSRGIVLERPQTGRWPGRCGRQQLRIDGHS